MTAAAPGPSASPTRRRGWRHWLNVIHRDLGYLAVGLTVIYAVSGVAVNHTHQWNPNYRFEHVEERFVPFPPGERDAMSAELVARLHLPGPPKSAFRSSPEVLELFYEGWSVRADVEAGRATMERPRDRPLLRAFNFLHLNDPKGAWTWVADLFALCLLTLALTGPFMKKGPTGLAGRGKWLILAGVAVPVLFLLLWR